MPITNRVSTRLLSKKLLSGVVSFRYEGVVDFVGGRLTGQYIDDKTAAFNNVTCLNTTNNNCDCCGDDGPPYYNCNSCNYYYLQVSNVTSVPSSSFKTSPSGGYYDSATNKGFKSLGYNGLRYGSQHSTEYYTCTNCSGNATEAYLRTNATGDFFGENSMAGIKAQDGSLWTWGCNNQGQLGNGNTTNRYSPVQVGTNSWKIVRGTYNWFAAIRQDDTLWTWGYNGYGNLGDNSTTYRSSPVQVLGSWKFIAVGYFGMHGIKSDNTLWGWGINQFGQIGDGTTTTRSSPVQVSGGGTWKFVMNLAAGGSATYGIKTDGTAYGWGYNNQNYTIGDGTNINRSSPSLVAGGFTDWSVITNHSLAWTYGIRSNGTLWCWGHVPLGVSSAVTYRSSPIQVGSATDHVSGSSHPNYGGVYVSTVRNAPFILSNGNVISYNGYDATRTTLYGSGSAVELIAGSNDNSGQYSGVYIIKNVI